MSLARIIGLGWRASQLLLRRRRLWHHERQGIDPSMPFMQHEWPAKAERVRLVARAQPLNRSQSGTHRPMTRRQHALFLFLPPLLLGWTSGVSEFGSVSFNAKWVHVCFAFFTYFPNWFSTELFSWIGAKAAKRWGMPLLPALVFGVFMTAALHAPFTIVRDALFEPYLAPGASFFKTWPPNYADLKYSTEASLAFASRLAFWLTVNIAAIHLMGFSRFGFTSFLNPADKRDLVSSDVNVPSQTTLSKPKPARSAQSLSRIYDRLPPEIGQDILYLGAQEHYTKVVTTKGSELIYMRFADAMALTEAAMPGQRVHRSYWVADTAVDTLEASGAKVSILCSNGDVIPVSRSYREQVRHWKATENL